MRGEKHLVKTCLNKLTGGNENVEIKDMQKFVATDKVLLLFFEPHVGKRLDDFI